LQVVTVQVSFDHQENSFSANNKQAMEVTIAFLEALVTHSMFIEDSLVADTQHVYGVLKAETSPLDDFTSSLTILSGLTGSKTVSKKDGDSTEFLGLSLGS